MNLVTIKHVAIFLSAKESTIYSWVHKGLIPFLKLNGLLRFDMDAIEQWVRSSQVEPEARRTKRIRKSPKQAVASIVRNAIDSVKGKAYNPSNGKPGHIQGLREEV